MGEGKSVVSINRLGIHKCDVYSSGVTLIVMVSHSPSSCLHQAIVQRSCLTDD